MEKLHYKTLEAAVKTYGPLTGEGKEEAEIKAAIAADEKKFTPEQVEEIYQAITNQAPPDSKKDQKGKFEVVKEFRDVADFTKRHYPGDDVSHFDKKRLAHLVKIGHVKAL